jgi:hypothetical protein
MNQYNDPNIIRRIKLAKYKNDYENFITLHEAKKLTLRKSKLKKELDDERSKRIETSQQIGTIEKINEQLKSHSQEQQQTDYDKTIQLANDIYTAFEHDHKLEYSSIEYIYMFVVAHLTILKNQLVSLEEEINSNNLNNLNNDNQIQDMNFFLILVK